MGMRDERAQSEMRPTPRDWLLSCVARRGNAKVLAKIPLSGHKLSPDCYPGMQYVLYYY